MTRILNVEDQRHCAPQFATISNFPERIEKECTWGGRARLVRGEQKSADRSGRRNGASEIETVQHWHNVKVVFPVVLMTHYTWTPTLSPITITYPHSKTKIN